MKLIIKGKSFNDEYIKRLEAMGFKVTMVLE